MLNLIHLQSSSHNLNPPHPLYGEIIISPYNWNVLINRRKIKVGKFKEVSSIELKHLQKPERDYVSRMMDGNVTEMVTKRTETITSVFSTLYTANK